MNLRRFELKFTTSNGTIRRAMIVKIIINLKKNSKQRDPSRSKEFLAQNAKTFDHIKYCIYKWNSTVDRRFRILLSAGLSRISIHEL